MNLLTLEMARSGGSRKGKHDHTEKGLRLSRISMRFAKRRVGSRWLADASAGVKPLVLYESKSFIFPKCSKAFLVA